MLNHVYTGPLEGLAPVKIAVASDRETMAASDLLDPATMTSLLGRFGAGYPEGDRRAIASLWSKWHFSNVIAHALAMNLLLERELPLGLGDIRIELSAEGYTTGLWVQNEGVPIDADDVLQRFESLIDLHLEPLVRALSNWSGAAPRVFWSNAGNYFEYFSTVLQTHPLADAYSSRPALELLETRFFANGRRNPLYRPIRYLPSAEGTQRVRQLCCLRYLLATVDYCENCPLTCLKKDKEAIQH